MRYVAKTYIGGEYIPGEIIEKEMLNDNLIEWLLKTGAIEEIASAGQAVIEVAANPPKEEKEPDILEGALNAPEVEPEEEMDDAPEIDVMAGIVKEEKKPARRKKGGKA